MKKISNYPSGFTMIELLVAMALFSTLVTIGVGGVVNALRTQRQVAAMLGTNSTLSTTIEQMVREMRTGYDFCQAPKGNNCPPGQPGVAFTNSNGDHVRYCFNPPSSQPGYLSRGIDPANAPNCNTNAMMPLTPTSTNISQASFTVIGQNVGDGFVPRVVINVTGRPNDQTLSGTSINLQTTVSARFNFGND